MNCRKLSQLDGWETSRLVWMTKPQEAAPAHTTAPTAATMVYKEKKVEAKKEPVVAKPVEVAKNHVAVAGQQAEDTKKQGSADVAQADETINAESTGSDVRKSKAGASVEATETTFEDADLNTFIENLIKHPSNIANAKTIDELETKIKEAMDSDDADKIGAQLFKKLLTISESDQQEFRKKYLIKETLNQEALKKAIEENKFKAQELVVMLSIMGKGDISKFFGDDDSPAVQRFEQILPDSQKMLETKRKLEKISIILNSYKNNEQYKKLLESYKKGEEPSDADKKAFIESIKNTDDKKIIEEALDTSKEHDMESEIVKLLKFDNKDFSKDDVTKAVESGKLNFREAQIALNILKAGSVPEAKKSDIWESLEKLIAMLTALANKFIASLDKQLSKNEPKHFEKSPWGTGDKKFALDTPFEKGKNKNCVTFEQMGESTKIYAMESGTIKIEPETAVGDVPQTISIITDGGAKIEYFGLDPAKLKNGSPVKAGDEIGATKINVSLKLRLTNKDKMVVDPTALLAPYIKTETKTEAKK